MDLIIAHLQGFDWWFGKVVVDYKKAKVDPPVKGFEWIYWFGDRAMSQVIFIFPILKV